MDANDMEEPNFVLNEDGLYPMMLAIKLQRFHIVKLFLYNKKVAFNLGDKQGYTCLHVAA